MKVCVIQPYYSADPADLDVCFRQSMALLAQCDESMDLIVLPERCGVPAAVDNSAQFRAAMELYGPQVFRLASETARRCHAIVFANFDSPESAGWRNTTHAFDREGNLVGKYYKAHPAPAEERNPALDCSYSYAYQPPTILELEGLRFGFMTCYDFYLYEAFPALARQNVDIIIGCSHQRTDTHDALELFGRFLCYNTNAWLVRASITLGEDSPVCGCSMVVSPEGKMVLNLESRIGLGVCEIDPTRKYYKPAGFRKPPKAHWQYIEDGRRPWLYRPGGSMMVPDDAHMPYPRICAHRGFSAVAPENSMAAFGAAVALGVQEIEFDLRWTKDGELVAIHDSTLDRVSTGTGKIREHSYAELLQFDFGVKAGESFRGLRILRFEEILQKFACQVILNIHLKNRSDEPCSEERICKIVALLDQYSCRRHACFVSGSDEVLEKLQRLAPDIPRCCSAGSTPEQRRDIVDRAIRYGCRKVQFDKESFDPDRIDKAHANGIRCNYSFTDDPGQAVRLMDMGIDCLLTNDCQRIAAALRDRADDRT